ncbi:MAG: hypothetical protein KC587_19570, partial [Nitrospira sp.]|nr:hypothetical protein [Nitrospira sp.]
HEDSSPFFGLGTELPGEPVRRWFFEAITIADCLFALKAPRVFGVVFLRVSRYHWGGRLKKSVSGVLAIFFFFRMIHTLRAEKWLRPC